MVIMSMMVAVMMVVMIMIIMVRLDFDDGEDGDGDERHGCGDVDSERRRFCEAGKCRKCMRQVELYWGTGRKLVFPEFSGIA